MGCLLPGLGGEPGIGHDNGGVCVIKVFPGVDLLNSAVSHSAGIAFTLYGDDPHPFPA